MVSVRRLFLAVFVVMGAVQGQYSRGWNFSWPTQTQQCQNVTIRITGGSPPWSVGLIPIGGVPVVWTVRADPGETPNYTNPLEARIPVQFPAGTHYTVALADSIGYAGGSIDVLNPTPLQRVRESTDARCLASIRPLPQEFTFDVFGSAAQCGNDFTFAWHDRVGRSPYSFSVIPLDTSYSPWDVRLAGGVVQPGVGWTVNMTEGTRFTVLMSNSNGWGRGGVGGVYEVTPSRTNTTSCNITQDYLGKVAWRADMLPTTLPSSPRFTTTIVAQSNTIESNVVTSPTRGSTLVEADTITRTGGSGSTGGPFVDPSSGAGGAGLSGSGGGGGGGSGGKAGAIAGGVVGGIVVIAAIIVLLWWLRRRRNDQGGKNIDVPPRFDLDGQGGGNGNGGGSGGAGNSGGSFEPKIVPYQPVPASPSQRYSDYTTVQHGNTTTSLPSGQGGAAYSTYGDVRPMDWSTPSTAVAGPAAAGPSSGTPYSGDGRPSSIAYQRLSSYGMPINHNPNPMSSTDHFSPPPAIAPIPALSNRMSHSSLSASMEQRRSSMIPESPPALPTKSISPPTFTSSRTNLPMSSSALPPGAGAASSSSGPLSLNGSDGTHPHQEFDFVRHSDGGGMGGSVSGDQRGRRETVELPPDYAEVPQNQR